MQTVRLTLLMLLTIALSIGCKGKDRQDFVLAPAVQVEENTQKVSAAEQKANYFKSKQEVESDEAWGIQVANLAKDLNQTVTACMANYISQLKPDELLVGAPAIITKDGVVTVMDDTCFPLVESLKNGLKLLEGKHAATEALARQWTLFADLYARTSRISVNIGASAKKRKLNHKALVQIQKELVNTVGPALIESSAALLSWTADNVEDAPPEIATMTPSEALKHWKSQIKATGKAALEMDRLWHQRGHKLLKADLYARVRFLSWLGRHWKRRATNERARLGKTRTGNNAFDQGLIAAGSAFYDQLLTYHREVFEVAMLAMKDKGTIDEPALKLGKQLFKKRSRTFKKAPRKVRWPSAS